jgi:hypothetical protein
MAVSCLRCASWLVAEADCHHPQVRSAADRLLIGMRVTHAIRGEGTVSTINFEDPRGRPYDSHCTQPEDSLPGPVSKSPACSHRLSCATQLAIALGHVGWHDHLRRIPKGLSVCFAFI